MLVEYTKLFRSVWLAGRKGGGKTSLGIALALRLVADGVASRIVSNTPLTIGELERWTDAYGAQQIEHAAIILDEAWMHFGVNSDRKARDEWIAYLRHREQYLILPSTLDLTREVNAFVVERLWNGLSFGLPLWIYGYSVQGAGSKLRGMKAKPDIGKYYWWFPQRVFRYYDHKSDPGMRYYVYTFGS